MPLAKGGYVYILTNMYNNVLYTGVTSNLIGRILEHKSKTYPKSFSARYNLNKLVYYAFFETINIALSKEKYIKGKSRNFKIGLINSMNSNWKDLYEEAVEKMLY